MSIELVLIKTLTLDKFTVEIYALPDNAIDPNMFDSMVDNLNAKEYPRGVVETLETVEGVMKLMVYEKNSNELLLASGFLDTSFLQ